MKTQLYIPRSLPIIKDVLTVSVLIVLVSLFNSGLSFRNLMYTFGFTVCISSLYFLVMKFLPYIEIDETDGKIRYRSEYGITYIFDASKITSIIKKSGLGGYEHAFYITFNKNSNETETMKFKSSYFNKSDLSAFIMEVKRFAKIQTNTELERFIS